MKKKFHLCDNDDFKRLIDAKQYYINSTFTIYYQKNNLNYSRFGISVGKKHGKAYERNKIKRQIRMMISKIFNYQLGYDYLILIRSRYKQQSFEENSMKLNELANKLKTRCNK
ncbi:MAG: ribonuclease P protein component [Bacilli bacterium]|jgi:ribonuclease P protein component|nr:ribonuclease P protein component [Bacilli bacterium]